VITELSFLFPELNILHEFFDEGWGFWGGEVYSQGKVINGYRGEYDANTSKQDMRFVSLCVELKGYDPREDRE